MKYYADYYDVGTDETNTMEFEAEGGNDAEVKGARHTPRPSPLL